MLPGETHLEMSSQRLAEQEWRVARQLALIERLRAKRSADR